MQKKLVFFDIDGTIYHYEKGVVEDTKNAIRELRAKGNLAFLCTGRTEPMITSDILEIGFDGIIGGAGTYVEYEGNVLYKSELDTDTADELIQAMRECGYMPVPEGHRYIYFEEPDKIVNEYKRAYKIYSSMIPDNISVIKHGDTHIAKISGAITKNSNYDELYRRLSDRFTFVNHGGELMELIPLNNSKAEGIKILLKAIDGQWENTYAFGDSFNDLEMLKYVNYGIAMGNSDKDLFEHVKYRTSDYDKGGIREALKRFELI